LEIIGVPSFYYLKSIFSNHYRGCLVSEDDKGRDRLIPVLAVFGLGTTWDESVQGNMPLRFEASPSHQIEGTGSSPVYVVMLWLRL
jgi:hypothetical protein